MKKQLKEELLTLAEKILQTKQDEQISSAELKKLAQQLYEKLTVLTFTESIILKADSSEEQSELLSNKIPSAEETPVEEEPGSTGGAEPSEKRAQEIRVNTFDFPEEEHDEYAPDGMEYNDSDDLHEPNTEKIKDIVAQMPPEAQEVDDLLEYILPRKYQKNDMEDIGGVHYDRLPQFEPLHARSSEPEKPKSLNDRLKKGIQIGINDRHAFVRHLFEGSNTDYNRVLSQLNTLKSKEEAINFVLNVVKPDYNNWEGKEEYEMRFLDIVENRFD